MKVRILLIILITVSLTVFFLENNQTMEVNLFQETLRISKAILLPSLCLLGFFIGYITGHIESAGKRRKRDQKEKAALEKKLASQTETKSISKTLNPEDHEYLN